MKRTFAVLIGLLSGAALAAAPWVYPSSQVGTVTCTDTRNGSKEVFRTESVAAAEVAGYFFVTGADGNARRMRTRDLGTVFVCTVAIDP